jgi:hypothetical protein
MGNFYTQKPAGVSASWVRFSVGPAYIQEEDYNRAYGHEACNSFYYTSEPSVREDSVVEGQDAGFDEEKRPWVHHLVCTPMLQCWYQNDGQVEINPMLPECSQPPLYRSQRN